MRHPGFRATLYAALALLALLLTSAPALPGQAPGAALVKAAAKGDLTTVQSMLAQGVPVDAPDKNGNTALMEAARTGKADVVAALIAAGAALDARNNDGWTAVMRAVMAAQAETLQTLLEAGARWDVTNAKGQTALDVALGNGTANVRPAMLSALANAGANVAGATVDGEPALVHAIESLQPATVAGLLRAGADPNGKDKDGTPAIVLAAKGADLRQAVDSAAALVAAGVDVNARDAQGRSALEHAVDISRAQYRREATRKNRGIVVYALTSRGADDVSIDAARRTIVENGLALFDTLIVEGRKKARADAAAASAGTGPGAGAPASRPADTTVATAAEPAGPPPAGCPAATVVTKLASENEPFMASQPIDLGAVRTAKALPKSGGRMKVFLTNGDFPAAAMDSSMVVPVKAQGDVIVALQFMNAGQPVVAGEYRPSAGYGKAMSVMADVIVTGGTPSGAVVTFVAAQGSDSGSATVTAVNEDYVCGRFDLTGGLGSVAGEFVARIEP